MKKVFLFLMACCLSLTMSAKVAYLLPNGCAYNGPSGDDADISGLPSENMDGINQGPEWRAAQWFYDEYVKTGKGEFVAVADFGTKYSQFSTIWIHLDRDNVAEDVLSYYNNDNQFLAHLKDFTAAGGNLLLSKHASQLLGDGKLNRLVRPETVGSNVEQRFSPEYPRKGYDWSDGETKWYVATKFNGRDNSTHPVFNNMEGGFSNNCKNVECLLVADHKHHTDFNCGIPRDWIHVGMNPDDDYETQKAKVDKFEEVCKCRIIGTWGNNEWMQYGGFVEFYPKGDDFKGTVLMYGLAAYCWCANNFGFAYENVQRMTRNGINYLENKDVKAKKGDLSRNIADLFLGEYNGKNVNNFITLHPDIEGWNPIYSTSDETIAICQDGKLVFKKNGTVTLHVDIVEDRDNQVWPKGTYRTDCQVTFTCAPSFNWTAEPGHAAITEDKPAAQAECTNMPGVVVKYRSDNNTIASIDENTGKITYVKAGTCNIYAYIEFDGTRYDSAPFELNVYEPTFQWNTCPETMKNGQKADIEFVVLYISAEEEYELSGAHAEIVDGKIYALAEGTITVTPKTVVNGETYYGEAKHITVTAAELAWYVNPENHEVSDPHDGTLMEDKPSIWALLNGESDSRVQYRSENTEYIDIDSNNFLIYKKPTEGDGVLIEAYVEIGDVEYTLSRKTKAVAPVAEWVTAPATEAYVGDVVAIAAKANYGAAPAGFETENCTYDAETGELTFTTEGTATVKPYVTAYDVRYYGAEVVSVNVTVKPTTTTYTRTVTPNKYGTICLPRTSIALEGATFYWPAYKDKPEGEVDFVTLEKVDVLTAGQGYFFFATSSEIKVTMSLAEEALESPLQHGVNDVDTRGMHGNFGPENLLVPDYEGELPNEYILSNNMLVYGSGNYIGANKAYLKMSEVPAGSPASEVPGRHYVRMVVEQSNTTTNILSVGAEHEATKIVRDGKLYILRAGSLYTVEGQLVK